LAPAQLELLVSLEMQRIKERERLLDLARRFRAPWFAMLWPTTFIPLAMIPIFFTERLFLVLFILFVAFGLCGVIQSEVKSTNRRIDALIELLEMDKKRPDA